MSAPPRPPLPRERLAIDARKVVHETMDGEVILIDLETGDYYSLRGAGFDAWALLQRGRTANEIASVIESRYAGGTDRAAVRADTYEVLGKLYEAGVIASLNFPSIPRAGSYTRPLTIFSTSRGSAPRAPGRAPRWRAGPLRRTDSGRGARDAAGWARRPSGTPSPRR